jgi:hypothetical protein
MYQDRERDAYVSYAAHSRAWQEDGASSLSCPDCGTLLGPAVLSRCAGCGRPFNEIDGMLFVLPAALRNIEEQYSPEMARTVPAEHL